MRSQTSGILLLITFLSLLFTTPTLAQSFQGKVVKVIDGDTVEVLHEGRAERIRLYGIDAPEKSQAYGNKAKQFVLDIAAQKIVTVEVKDTDRYGRTVGEVILPSGKSLNRELVQEGYAWWYRKYSNDASIGGLESEARAAGRGLWRDKNPVPPWEWRQAARVQKNNQPPAKKNLQDNQSSTIYHGNIKSNVFHQPSGKYYNCKNCVREFRTREEAVREGYKPCGICRP